MSRSPTCRLLRSGSISGRQVSIGGRRSPSPRGSRCRHRRGGHAALARPRPVNPPLGPLEGLTGSGSPKPGNGILAFEGAGRVVCCAGGYGDWRARQPAAGDRDQRW